MSASVRNVWLDHLGPLWGANLVPNYAAKASSGAVRLQTQILKKKEACKVSDWVGVWKLSAWLKATEGKPARFELTFAWRSWLAPRSFNRRYWAGLSGWQLTLFAQYCSLITSTACSTSQMWTFIVEEASLGAIFNNINIIQGTAPSQSDKRE